MKATKKMITAVSTGVIGDVNHDNFESYVQAVFVAAGTIRDNIQVLVEFAVFHAMENDNQFALIEYLLKIASGKYGSGVRTETLQKYLEHVVYGAKWMTLKGESKFKKATKKTKVKYNIEHLETVKWYNHDNKGKSVPKLDFIQMLEQTAKRWEKGHEKAEAGEAELVNPDSNDALAAEFMQWLESKKKAEADKAHAAH